MREIKFRAWRTKQRNMDYSDSWNWLGAFLEFHERTYANGYERMQFTGLTDRNGKEIYECDVVIVFLTGETFEVVWDTVGSGFLFSNTDKEKGKHGAIDWYDFEDECSSFGFEIIGNIYENPELLERNESA